MLFIVVWLFLTYPSALFAIAPGQEILSQDLSWVKEIISKQKEMQKKYQDHALEIIQGTAGKNANPITSFNEKLVQ